MRIATIIAFLVLIIVAPPNQALGEITAIKEYSGGRLTLELPYETILADELVHVSLSIENAGAEPIVIVKDGMNDLVQWVRCQSDVQICFDYC